MISQDENGDDSSVTRSAISAGTINITNPGSQTQDVSTLSRDTTNTNGNVAKTPDVNAMLSDQADLMQAAQAAGQVVAQGIGTYADMKEKEAADAVTAAANNQDIAAGDAASADFDNWKEGGDYRTALHIVGGALVGGLGGGALDAFGGAAGAGLTSSLAKELQSIGDGVSDTTGSSLIGRLAENVVASIAGAAVGGTAGAATGTAVNLYNQDKNEQEKELEDEVSAARKIIATLKAATALGSGVGATAEEEAEIPTVPVNGVLGALADQKTIAATQQSIVNQLVSLFDKTNAANYLVIDGENISATSPGRPGGSNLSGSTKVMNSQALTDAQIQDYAQSIAGSAPLTQKAPGVFFATLDNGETVTLRSVSSSAGATGARWTIDIRGNTQ
ncbi:hypothetical protein EHZ19_31900 [Paraburkholderia bannensis]|nr:hypothetical protein [Paraburkholderia bannensis]RQM43869.1 hypothetical protein EHZ19_31900 [Paraburkholderia bannensis]